MLRVVWLASVTGFLGLLACDGSVTEVVVVVTASDAVGDRARFLAVRVYDSEGVRVVDRVDILEDTVTFPARVPLTPRDGDASRSWRVEVDAQTAFGCVFGSAMAAGGYEAGVAVEQTLTLSPTTPDPCPLGPGCMGDCDDGLSCTDDSCVEERCLNDVVEGQCAIAGVCLAGAASNPEDACQVCAPETAQGAWTLAPGCDSAEVARLDDGAVAGGAYGRAVAMDDGLIIAGAPAANDDTGQAFAFRLGAAGAWAFDGELVPRDVATGSSFGEGVAVSGEWAVVGAPMRGLGRVYMFRRSAAGGWVADQELTSARLADVDRFGASVAIDGDLAVVGATHVEAPIGESGAVWVFRRNAEDRWVEVAYVEPPEPQRSGFFGNAVAISGARFVVGSMFFDKGGMEGSGAAYLYELDGDVVSAPIELAPPVAHGSAFFGHRVAIEGTRVAVAATQDNLFSNDGGAVYVYDAGDSGGSVPLIGELGMGPAGGQAGLGLAVIGRYVAVAYPPSGDGFVTLFEESDGVFSGLPRILGSDMADTKFGRGIAGWDRWMVASAPNGGAGALYVYELRR